MPRRSSFCVSSRRRFRVVNRRQFVIAQAVLALVAVGALALSAMVISRSIRTAGLNKRLVEIYTVSGDRMEAEIAAPPIEDAVFTAQAESMESSSYGVLSAMVMPDGSPIEAPGQESRDEMVSAIETAC